MLSRNMDAPESAHRHRRRRTAGCCVLVLSACRGSCARPNREMVQAAARHDHVEYGAEGGHVSVGLRPSGPTVTANTWQSSIHRRRLFRHGVVRIPSLGSPDTAEQGRRGCCNGIIAQNYVRCRAPGGASLWFTYRRTLRSGTRRCPPLMAHEVGALLPFRHCRWKSLLETFLRRPGQMPYQSRSSLRPACLSCRRLRGSDGPWERVGNITVILECGN